MVLVAYETRLIVDTMPHDHSRLAQRIDQPR